MVLTAFFSSTFQDLKDIRVQIVEDLETVQIISFKKTSKNA